MKKYPLIILFIVIALLSNAQSTLESLSYQGLRIIHDNSQIWLYGDGQHKWSLGSTGAAGSDFLLYDKANGAARLSINENNGNVIVYNSFGMGTTNPIEKVHIENGKLLLRSTDNTNNAVHPAGLKFTTDNTGGYSQILVRRGGSSTDIGLQFNTYLTDQALETMTLTKGKVGIGTANPGAKLHVCGTIQAKEIRVNLTGCDFVFEENYRLRSLDEVEKYIKENNRLPEMESAEEMESRGTELGELNSKLLQKIEELTLYMIEINKEVKSLRQENSELKGIVTNRSSVR